MKISLLMIGAFALGMVWAFALQDLVIQPTFPISLTRHSINEFS